MFRTIPSAATLSTVLSLATCAGLAALSVPSASSIFIGRVAGARLQPLDVVMPGVALAPRERGDAAHPPAGVNGAEPVVPQSLAPPEPEPPAWTDAEIAQALRDCLRLLAPIAAKIDVSEPIRSGQCGAPAPVLVRRLGAEAKVEISPPALMNCRMAATVHQWVEKTLQPAAREMLGTAVVRLSAGAYSCRNRYNSPFERISEHAFANAVDIAGFTTADGRVIEVQAHWGPTARDVKAGSKPAAKDGPAQPTPAKADVVAIPTPAPQKAADRTGQRAALEKASLGAREVSAGPTVTPPGDKAKPTVEGTFLRRLHQGACDLFGTVLGPEANDAHRDHFHFDLAARRRATICE